MNISHNKNTKTFNQLGNKKCFDLGFHIKKTAVFKGEKFVDIADSIQISVHEFNNEKLELKWQVDISQYGERRLDRHGKEIDSNTHNNVSGELMGYEDTLVVPLAGGQLLGLNIQDGSFKWMLERGANRLLAHSNKYLYSYYWGEISEIDIQTGESLRTLDLSPFLKGIKDGLFY